MSPILLAVVIFVGIVAAGIGLWMMRSTGGSKEPLQRPALVDKTDAAGRERIIERWIYLALELCRSDGAIDEGEIAAIEDALTKGVVSVPREEANRMIHNALRATIREARVGPALEEIAKHADSEYRAWVVDGLESIAGADGTLNREERLFLDRVRQELGV